MAESQALAVVDNTVTGVTVFANAQGVDDILAKVRKEIDATPRDISTPAGRAAIKSLARKIARTKTGLDDLGKDLVAERKREINTVDAERRRLWDELEALQKDVRKPLDDYEASEKTRTDGHEAALTAIANVAVFLEVEPTSDELRSALVKLDTMRADGRAWQEFQARADLAFADAFRSLNSKLTITAQREKEKAELEEFRRQEAERTQKQREQEQRDREEAIAREAADKARRAAEEKAEREAQAERDRIAAEAAERERLAGIERDRLAAEVAERERLAAIERERFAEAARQTQERLQREAQESREREEAAAREAAAAIERAAESERQRVAAEQLAEQERQAAKRREEEAGRKAVEEEQARAAEAARKLANEAAAREADRAHKTRVNGEAAKAIQAAGVAAAAAGKIIQAIADGKIPHVKISY